MSRGVVIAYATCALIWGTTWHAIRVCIDDDGGYPALCSLALRFVIAVAILLPIAARCRPWPAAAAQWAWLAFAGALDAGGYALVYVAEERVSGGVAAVLYGTQPIVLALLLAATKMDTITRAHVIGALVSLAGVVVLSLDQLDISAKQAAGVVMVIASVVVATLYSMVMKRHAGGVHGVVATAVFLTSTAIVLAILAVCAGDAPPWPPPVAPTIALLYLAIIGTVVAFLSYFWLLGRTSLLVTSTFVFVFPIIALIVDALFEHKQPLTVKTCIGSAITLLGLAVSLGMRRPSPSTAATTA